MAVMLCSCLARKQLPQLVCQLLNQLWSLVKLGRSVLKKSCCAGHVEQ